MDRIFDFFRRGRRDTRVDGPSSIDILRYEAHTLNLLGESTTIIGFNGSKDRLGQSQAREITKGVTARLSKNVRVEGGRNYFVLSEEEKAMFVERVKTELKNLSDYGLHGAELGKFVTEIDLFANGTHVKKDNKSHYHSLDDPTVNMWARLAYKLSYAVALLEGNLPPNDLGYIPDHSLSMVRRDEIAVDCVSDAHKLIVNSDDEGLLKIYDAIVDRVQSKRPVFHEKNVRSAEMPKFFK